MGLSVLADWQRIWWERHCDGTVVTATWVDTVPNKNKEKGDYFSKVFF